MAWMFLLASPVVLGVAAGVVIWALDATGLVKAEDVGETVGEIAGSAVVGVMNAVPSVLEAGAPAIIDGLSKGVVTTRDALKGREVAAATAATVIILTVCAWWSGKVMVERFALAQN